jgi:hypothetical protein
MAKSRRKAFKPSPQHEISVYPILVALVGGVIAFGMLHYSLLLAVLSAGFVGFFSWLWWWRQNQKSTATPQPLARHRSAAQSAKKRRR